jgi:predicted acylesterase/phospholipase RssA
MRDAPPKLSDDEIKKYFGATPPPTAGTFELALVLGGTVSAGAYTAGVLDFFFEALEEWTRQKSDPVYAGLVPRHEVSLRFITGTSGGGVNAAIAARALAYAMPHVVRGTSIPAKGTGNLFYDTWVNHLSLTDFLATEDITGHSVNSVLNGLVLDRVASAIEVFEGEPPPPRPYIANPLRVIVTCTNMRGIPYRLSLNGGSQAYIDHADFCRFAFVYGNESFVPRPDEFVVGFGAARLPQMVDWQTFGRFALATSAFPVGLPARNLVRPYQHYQYRVIALPDPAGPQLRQLLVDWEALGGDDVDFNSDYQFFAVDGGVTDNEPIQLARTALAGVNGYNLRDGMRAQRGVLLVDPFAGEADLGPIASGALPADFFTLTNALPQQTRYDTQDILMALDDNVFSRFMISAQRAGLSGGKAIASSGLDAFLGFACADFRRHDYLLGRANCQTFLKNDFLLPPGAAAFGNGWDGVPVADFQQPLNGGMGLPIIPLVGTAGVPETPAPWPVGALDPEIFRTGIEARFKALVNGGLTGGLWEKLAAWLIENLADGSVATYVIGLMKGALEDAKL